MSAPQFSKSENKSTDEDYESDDSDVDRLRTRQLDPAADAELLEDLWTAALPAFSCGDGDRARLLAAAASVFVADTAEDGPLAGLFLTDGPSDRNYEGVVEFLEVTTGYELSPLSAQYLDLLLCQPYKEGITFEPLLKEIFSSKLDLKLLYFLTGINEDLPWYVKQFAKKMEYFEEEAIRNVYYIDSKDILPEVHLAKASVKDENVLEDMMLQAVPEYPHSMSKVLRGFTETSHEPLIILGRYQEPLGAVVVDPAVDVEELNRLHHTAAFNHFLAPHTSTATRRLSQLNINCFAIETYFMEWPGNPVLVLSELFAKYPDRDYCITLLPRTIRMSWTIASLFSRVSPRAGADPGRELYVCHKASLRSGVKVSTVRTTHLPGLASLVREEAGSEVILRDIRHSLDTAGSDAETLVASSCGQVIGVGVVRTEYHAPQLRRTYHGHLGDTPVRLHHLVIAPVFQRFARYFLAQIMKITNKSSLIYPVFKVKSNSREAERYSAITVLDEFQMAKPRQKLSNTSRNLKMLDIAGKIQPPFTLFYLNKADSMLPVRVHLERIFIIGSGPLALSAAEEMSTCRLQSFPNLFLVTEDEETDFSPNVVNSAPTAWGHLQVGRRRRLSLHSVVNILLAKPSKIDRQNRKIEVNNNVSYTYDKLLLCVDTSSYSLNNHFVCRKGIRNMKNFFTIESLTSARRCLDWFQTQSEKFSKDGYIIILGHSLHALAVINSLIELGAPAKCILLVKIDEDLNVKEPIFEEHTIRDKVIHHLKTIGVRIKAYTLVDYKKDARQDLINTVIFSKNEELVEAACLMMVNCSNPGVSADLLRLLDEADLVVLEDKVSINHEHETNDPRILAAGSGTRLDRISGLRLHQPPHQSTVSAGLLRQLGCEAAAAEPGPGAGARDTFSVHQERLLPGGFTYLHLATQTDSSGTKCIQTSSRDGEFKLFINSSDKICGVHLLHHGYLATDNLARLAGLHVSTFPGLDTAEDLAAFFQQPKFQAVFHEDFHNLRRQIRAAVLGRQDSGALVGEIVLNPEREEAERLARLREAWEERRFSREVEDRLRRFIRSHSEELQGYSVDTSEQ